MNTVYSTVGEKIGFVFIFNNQFDFLTITDNLQNQKLTGFLLL